jgi:hypothetical protein
MQEHIEADFRSRGGADDLDPFAGIGGFAGIRFTTETQRHRERETERQNVFFSVTLCVLCASVVKPCGEPAPEREPGPKCRMVDIRAGFP